MSYVNKELLEALKAITSHVEDVGNPCSVSCASDAAFNVLYEKAISAIAHAEAEESMNSSMREALRYIAWECPSYSDAVECAKAAIGDEGKIVPTAPGNHRRPHQPSCAACRLRQVRTSAGLATGKQRRAVMHLNEIATKHNEWVERMGWHNKTVLEALALIASEVGEAVNECRGEAPTEKFGTELADIIVRTLDLMVWHGINPEETILAKMAKNEANGTRGRRI